MCGDWAIFTNDALSVFFDQFISDEGMQLLVEWTQLFPKFLYVVFKSVALEIEVPKFDRILKT